MWFSSGEVIRLFLWSLVFGLCSGAFYDIFRIVRIARRPTRRVGPVDTALCVIEDLLYWLILAAAYCVFIYDVAGGRLRLISLAACAAGHAAWHFTLGRAVIFAADRIIAAVRAVLRLIFRLTVLPLARLIRILVRPGVIILAALYDKLKRSHELSLARRGYGVKKGK